MENITLAHGNGGRYMRELIEECFAKTFADQQLNTHLDAASIQLPEGEVMITTDGFTVQPIEFPGGDIGELAIFGTTNDLAVSGATPIYLTLNAFLEEGLEFALLQRVINSMAEAARKVGIHIVAGDTKVLPRGHGGQIYFATTGVGIKNPDLKIGMNQVKAGDAIIVSGPIGNHGISVMLAREQFGMRGEVYSDCDSVLPITKTLCSFEGLKFMRDPTRGGLASVCHEIAQASGLGVHLNEQDIPIDESVKTVCEILGYDPFYLACEGRVVAIVDDQAKLPALDALQQLETGKDARIIGSITETSSKVILETPLGGQRVLEELEDDPLPRIC